MLLFDQRQLPRPEYLGHDGVRLAFRLAGDSGPPLLLIHGNSCDSAFFTHQIKALAGNHQVLAVDLRGHGLSDKPRQKYTFAGFADDCAAICSGLGWEQILIVGHSMGGAVSMELADRHPGLVKAMVALDSTLFIHRPKLEPLLEPLIDQMEGPGYLEAFRGFFESLFTPRADPALKEQIWRRMAQTPQHVMTALLEEMLNWQDGATRRYKQPLLYVAGSRWRTDRDELKAACHQTKFQRLEYCGHFMTLEEPEHINGLVAAFSETIH